MNENWKALVLLLQEIAKDKGISQIEIAEKTGITQSNVSRIFSLKYCPKLETFLAISQAVGVNFFFESKDSPTDLNVLSERAMDELGRRNQPIS